jgi:UDP-N-acetylmuramoyl-L-alanyl-D-glutamate--2,6-diaminopimelate ligase
VPRDSPPVISPTRPESVPPLALGVLHDLAGGVLRGDPGVRVSGVTLSSSAVRPGDLYAALPGARTHGARFASDAIGRGAAALLTDPAGAALLDGVAVALLVVESPRTVLGRVAAAVYGQPAERLRLIAVTGTQGKTTTTQLASAGSKAAGRRTAVIGTMGTWIDGDPVGGALTTPEAPDLHALFAVMVQRGVEVCVLEVSSHALVMGRVDGVVFDVAAFTNLGRDHLDFHGSLEGYFAAKADLFSRRRARHGVVNVDDPYGRRLVDRPEIPTSTFSAAGRGADWTATAQRPDRWGTGFDVVGPRGQRVSTAVRLPGAFNVANALCALACVAEAGMDLQAAAGGIAAGPEIAGRMQRVDRGQPFTVIVDYAHKPDAVAAALGALRPVTEGALTIVLGAGGDRDRGKRPIMGEIADRLADVVIVTDDNPRSEDPAAIRAEILAGTGSGGAGARVLEIADRRAAITRALASASRGDTVLIAGKGHERGQQMADRVLPFDDAEVAAAVLDDLVAVAGASTP